MKHTGNWIGGLILFAAGLGIGWAVRTLVWAPQAENEAAQDEDDAPAPEIAPADMRVQVTTVEATRGALPITLGAPGIVRAAPAAQRTFSSRAGGRVLEIPVVAGQQVKPGDLLVSLDPTGAQTALSQARATLAERANQLAEFERSGAGRQKIELGTAVQRAISQAALLEAQVVRLESLHSDGLVSDKALAEAQQALESARSERVLAERAQSAFGDSGETLQRSTLVAARDAAELAMRDAERAFAEVDVRAPSEGQIVELFVRSGEMVAPGSSLGTLLAPVGREVVFQVAASSAGDIGIGTRANWLDSRGETQGGAVVRIDGQVEATGGTLEAIVKPDHESAQLLPGTRVFGEIVLRTLPSAVLVPERAVLRAADVQVVVVMRDGKAASVPIKLLGRHGGLAAIEGDVREHERVVVDGGYNLPDGASVVERSAR